MLCELSCRLVVAVVQCEVFLSLTTRTTQILKDYVYLIYVLYYTIYTHVPSFSTERAGVGRQGKRKGKKNVFFSSSIPILSLCQMKECESFSLTDFWDGESKGRELESVDQCFLL